MKHRIAPSILSADFTRLGEQVRLVERAGADLLHVDVMDGHFVPNLNDGPLVVEALRRTTELELDVHLMITNPEDFLDPFIDAGAHHISFHVEVVSDPVALASRVRERDVRVGIVVNPETPIERALEVAEHFDRVLVMTVHPGFGGQGFLGENLQKVRELRRWEASRAGAGSARRLEIQVDGGLGPATIALSAAAGADIHVAGNAIFGAADPGAAIAELRALLDAAPPS